MAVCAMNSGKHVAIEAPAATAIQECWDLVDASEQAAEIPALHKIKFGCPFLLRSWQTTFQRACFILY